MFKYLKLNDNKLNDDRPQSELRGDTNNQPGLSEMEKAAIQLVLLPHESQVVNLTASRKATTVLQAAANNAVSDIAANRGADASDPVVSPAGNYEERQTVPMTYFHSYSVEESDDDEAIDQTHPNSANPGRQPAILGRLIGTVVVVATLASGFVIADTLKNQPSTAKNQPLQPSSQLSFAARNNNMAGMWRPQVVSPVTRRTAAPLPNPKASMGLHQTPSPQTVPLILPQPKGGIALNQNFPPLPAPLILPQPAMPAAAQRMPDVASRPSADVVSPQPVSVVPQSNQLDVAPNERTPAFTPIAAENVVSTAVERPVVEESRSKSDVVESGTPVGDELSTPMPPQSSAVAVPVPIVAANPVSAILKQAEPVEPINSSAVAESPETATADISPIDDDTDKTSFTW